MPDVTLKNGAQAHDIFVTTVMIQLRQLVQNERGGAIAFYELVEKCRKPDHKLWGGTGKLLEGFLDGSGRVHSTFKDIILSAAQGEGVALALVSPIKAQDKPVAQEQVKTKTKHVAPEIDVLVAHFKRLRPIVEFVSKAALGKNPFGLRSSNLEYTLNPCYAQTCDLGVVLCQYYSGPSGLMTPLGFLEIDHTCIGNDLHEWHEKVDQRLGLKPFWGEWHEEKAKNGTVTKVFGAKSGSQGDYGPGWTVLRDMDGKPFEETKTKILGWFLSPETERLVEYDEAKKLWDVVCREVYPDSDKALAKARAFEQKADEDQEDPRVVGYP